MIFAQTALLLAALLISCGDTADTGIQSTDTSPATEATETVSNDGRLPAPAVTDMNGAELRILNSTPESFNWATTTIIVEEADGDILNDGSSCSSERILMQLKPLHATASAVTEP